MYRAAVKRYRPRVRRSGTESLSEGGVGLVTCVQTLGNNPGKLVRVVLGGL